MMETKLKEYFPMLRTRQELMTEIENNHALREMFGSWKDYEQKEFLDFCTGVRGVKMLYDAFFKEVFNPEYAPERLGGFLSQILGQRVTVIKVLPNDTTRISDENALLITDIVVQLEDGSIVNVEVQKIGYVFPGERSACYSADLLLRQYKRIRDEKKKKFTYKDVKPVYVIVLFENSPMECKQYEESYIHHFKSVSDTGLKLNLLQEFYFISLDIFQKELHNKGITGKLQAWLTFLCMDDPEYIEKLIREYPEFKPMYEDVYRLCLNVEDVMGLFSEELRMLDRNTAQFMIDTQQEKIDAQRVEIEEQQGTIKEQQGTIKEQQGTIKEQQGTIEKQQEQLEEKDVLIKELKERLKQAEIGN